MIMYKRFRKAYSKEKVKLSTLLIAPFLRYSLYLRIFKFASVKMFSVIAILEHFLFLEALKDSKIPYLFLTDLFSVEFHRSLKNALLLSYFFN